MAKDGFDQLSGLGAALKERISVTFIDEWGNEEAGIDGGTSPSFLFHSIGRSYGTVGSVLKGGVFKEFLTSYVFTWILLRFAADYAIKFD